MQAAGVTPGFLHLRSCSRASSVEAHAHAWLYASVRKQRAACNAAAPGVRASGSADSQHCAGGEAHDEHAHHAALGAVPQRLLDGQQAAGNGRRATEPGEAHRLCRPRCTRCWPAQANTAGTPSSAACTPKVRPASRAASTSQTTHLNWHVNASAPTAGRRGAGGPAVRQPQHSPWAATCIADGHVLWCAARMRHVVGTKGPPRCARPMRLPSRGATAHPR